MKTNERPAPSRPALLVRGAMVPKPRVPREPSDLTLCRRLKMAIPWHEEQGHPETVNTLAAAARRIDRARREHAALVLAMTTMRQIAGGQRNTRDRRNARATLTWLAALNTGGATERKVSA